MGEIKQVPRQRAPVDDRPPSERLQDVVKELKPGQAVALNHLDDDGNPFMLRRTESGKLLIQSIFDRDAKNNKGAEINENGELVNAGVLKSNSVISGLTAPAVPVTVAMDDSFEAATGHKTQVTLVTAPTEPIALMEHAATGTSPIHVTASADPVHSIVASELAAAALRTPRKKISKEQVEATKAHLTKEGFAFEEKAITATPSVVPQEQDIESITIQINKADKNGYPTEEALKDLVLERYFSTEIGTEISVEKVRGGAFTQRIFAAYLNEQNTPRRAVFFLKISSEKMSAEVEHREPWKNIRKVQERLAGKLGFDSRYAATGKKIPQKNLPILTWAEKFFVFKDRMGYEHVIEITHAAHGIPVADIIKKKDQALQCAEAVGKALGSFQQAFMIYEDPNNPNTWKTIAHGDFHTNNILFDSKTSRVYFIDNETMSNTLDRTAGIANDLHSFIGSINFNCRLAGLPEDEGKKIVSNFTKGYVESFNPAIRERLKANVKSIALTHRMYEDLDEDW